MHKRFLLILAMALTTFATVQAKVRLHHLVSDNMVLQQNAEARLWGWADKGKKVSVTVSWAPDVYLAQADNKGRWEVKVKTPEASYTPLSITFDDGNGAVTVNNVLAGEVWVCAGQSNMEMPVRGFGQCPVEGYNDVVIDARQHRGVHYCKIPSAMSMTPQEDALCEWKEITPESVQWTSATGYFFGRLMHRALDIPIGLIEANKGGTRVESWLTKENLKKFTDEPLDSAAIVKKYDWDYHRPLLWGNATFNPVLKYTIKGIIFYQGCSNVDWGTPNYAELLALLVKQWRASFGNDVPFYFVQIAPYRYENNDNGISAALLREQQFKAVSLIPNSEIVCTNDLVYPYETTQIHPCQKQQVGERLAAIALNRDYGMKSLMCQSPSYKDMTIKNDTVLIHFQNDYNGMTPFEDIRGFEVAGEDRVFHPAKAAHFWQPGGGYWDEAVIVTSPEVKNPVAVRYCFRNFQLGNLKNQAHLPLFPFRTDNW